MTNEIRLSGAILENLAASAERSAALMRGCQDVSRVSLDSDKVQDALDSVDAKWDERRETLSSALGDIRKVAASILDAFTDLEDRLVQELEPQDPH